MVKQFKNRTGRVLGASCLALGSSMAALNATVIVDNLTGDALTGDASFSRPWPDESGVGVVFNTGGSGSGPIGTLGTVKLAMDFTSIAAVTVNLETYNGSSYSSLGAIGTISPLVTGPQIDLVTLSGTTTLNANSDYAFEFSGTSGAYLETTQPGSPPTVLSDTGGTILGFDNDDSVPPGNTMIPGVDVEVVPEASNTGTFMGYGALTIAAGRLLRRKAAAVAKV